MGKSFQTDSMEDNFLLEVKIAQQRRSYYLMSSLQLISYSRLFVIDKRITVRAFKKKIFEFFRPIIKSPELSG